MSTQKIVVGVNGSAASDAALEWAIQEAASRGAEIIAVHVLKPIGASGGTTVRDVRLREFDYLGDDVRSHVKKELFGPLTSNDGQASDHRCRRASSNRDIARRRHRGRRSHRSGQWATQHDGGSLPRECCPRVDPQNTASFCVDSFGEARRSDRRHGTGSTNRAYTEADLVASDRRSHR